MLFLKNKIKLYVALGAIITSLSSAAIADILMPHDSIAQKQVVLNLEVKGAAGVLPYFTDQKGKAYVMISREVAKKKKNQYCEFSGKADYDNGKNKYDSLIDTALKELKEESSMVFEFTKSYVINNSYFYYNTNPDFRLLMALTKVGYKPSSVFNDARAAAVKNKLPPQYFEKNDFQWVSVDSLMTCMNNNQNLNVKLEVLKANVQNAELRDTTGMTKLMTLDIRKRFFSSLKGLKSVLPHITVPANAPAPKAPVPKAPMNKAAKKAAAQKAAVNKKAQVAAKKAAVQKAAVNKKAQLAAKKAAAQKAAVNKKAQLAAKKAAIQNAKAKKADAKKAVAQKAAVNKKAQLAAKKAAAQKAKAKKAADKKAARKKK